MSWQLFARHGSVISARVARCAMLDAINFRIATLTICFKGSILSLTWKSSCHSPLVGVTFTDQPRSRIALANNSENFPILHIPGGTLHVKLSQRKEETRSRLDNVSIRLVA